MKYFSLKSVASAYKANSESTKNKFWGLLAILSCIDDTVVPAKGYSFRTANVSSLLEDIFHLGEDKKQYSGDTSWNIMLSKMWTKKVPEQMLPKTPNVYDILVWYFRNRQFDDNIDNQSLLKLFLESIHISIADAKCLFDFKERDITYSTSKYEDNDLGKTIGLAGANITIENSAIVSSPGELSRAPFIQTLYAGQAALECLLITQFDFTELYSSGAYSSKRVSSLQKIYFGTPGSGKSFTVKGIVEENREFAFRTTFHPDTDYASFVGSYKPVVSRNGSFSNVMLTISELANILKESCETTDSKVAAINAFGIEYADYFNGKIADFSKKELLSLAGLPDTYDGDLSAMNNLRNELVTKGIIHTDAAISYEFVPQAFTNAYVAAWQNPGQKVYLVIEEINRGNCAQIFGDLFQLLDRDGSGLSEYPIKADTDLKNYLEDIDVLGPDHEGIRNGELRLPSNLHILATMNTSDQSLFPMDSAFKRRWDWEYVPSDPGCEESQFEITIGESKYSWAAFMVEANKRILKLSESEDKQMGNFFIKKNLSEDEFKSKVMFYLWSEVCKDFYKSGSFFKNANSGDEEFTFNQLYPKNEKTTGMLQGFMKHLGISEL